MRNRVLGIIPKNIPKSEHSFNFSSPSMWSSPDITTTSFSSYLSITLIASSFDFTTTISPEDKQYISSGQLITNLTIIKTSILRGLIRKQLTIFWPRGDSRRAPGQVFVKLGGKLLSLNIVIILTILVITGGWHKKWQIWPYVQETANCFPQNFWLRTRKLFSFWMYGDDQLTKVLTSLASFGQVVTSQAGEVGPCSAWLTWSDQTITISRIQSTPTRSVAMIFGSAVPSARIPISVGPATWWEGF